MRFPPGDLRDGREVYIYGEKVADVTTHPAFQNSVRTTARLYDSLHDPARQDVVTAPTDTGNGGFTHLFAAQQSGLTDAMTGFAEQCMAEYLTFDHGPTPGVTERCSWPTTCPPAR